MIHTSKYTVNLSPFRGSTEVNLSQYETGRQIEFALIDNDTVYIPTGTTVMINGTKPDGNVYSAEGTVDPDSRTATFNEDDQLTAIPGKWPAKLKLIHAGEVLFTSRLLFAVDEDVVEPDAIPSDSQIDGIIAEARHYAEEAKSSAYGSPLVARTVAEMTDRSRVYVYIGSEEGYDPGYWYYHNGTEWTFGGSYNAIDETLEVVGKAADAKTTGDALDTKVDKLEGFGLSSNDFTSAEKEKLAAIENGATRVIIDSAMSDSSSNPVQNKILKAYVDSGDETDVDLNEPGRAADAQVTGNRIQTAVDEYRRLIETERSSRTSAIDTEARTRSSEISAEVTARKNQVRAEAAARTEAINAETAARAAAINAEKTAREAAIAELQRQIDGNITSYFFDYDPTRSNRPASEWTSDSVRETHLGDLFYNTKTGYMWRYQKTDGGFNWQRISDTDVTKALGDIETIKQNLSATNTTVASKADKAEIPTKVSDLINDSDFASKEEVERSISVVVDSTFTKSGKAADAKATGDALSTKVDKVSGKGLSDNNYTTYEREKLAAISPGATRVIVDYSMNESSSNPVQSRIIKKYVDDLIVEAMTAVNEKVNKVDGYGLSSNDFTSAEKEKLNSITPGSYMTKADLKLITTAEIDAMFV